MTAPFRVGERLQVRRRWEQDKLLEGVVSKISVISGGDVGYLVVDRVNGDPVPRYEIDFHVNFIVAHVPTAKPAEVSKMFED